MRLGGYDGPGTDRCGYIGEDVARHDGLSRAGNSAWMGCVEEDTAGSWNVELDVGESYDEETIEQVTTEVAMGTGYATHIVALRRETTGQDYGRVGWL